MIKRFTLRLKLPLYNKLRTYANDNGFSNITQAIIFILNQFFKNPI